MRKGDAEGLMAILYLAIWMLFAGFGVYYGVTELDVHWFLGIICGGFLGTMLGCIAMLYFYFFMSALSRN